jgi:hypothetical protein
VTTFPGQILRWIFLVVMIVSPALSGKFSAAATAAQAGIGSGMKLIAVDGKNSADGLRYIAEREGPLS